MSKITAVKSSASVVRGFVFKRSLKSAAIWAFIIIIYMASKSIGYAKLYTTPASREKFAATFANNIGINAILGKPHAVNTVGGYTAWNGIGIVVIVLSIWTLLLATKYLRGEEDNNRTEMVLSSRLDLKNYTISTLAGLGLSLLVLFVALIIGFMVIGADKQVGFSAVAAAYFALSCISAGVMFLAVGALTSQIMPTRTRASSLGALIFGVAFLIRAAGDVSSHSWLIDLSPLGWIEKLQPLANTQPLWFIPIVLFSLIVSLLALKIASQRDLGDSILADSGAAADHYGLLNSLYGLSFRLSRMTLLSWGAALFVLALFYGVLTKSASQALNQSASVHKAFSKLANTQDVAIATVFLGIAFFLYMVVLMCFATNAMSKVRDEEANQALDNVLVRPQSRISWLLSRISYIVLALIILAVVASLGSYIGTATQHLSLSFSSILLAGFNTIAPAIFSLGFCMMVLGFIPRLTSVLGYALVGWCFLVQMLASGLNLNHWILDSNLLYHINFAPAVHANWTSNIIITCIGLLLAGIGMMRFNRRDLVSE